MNDIINIKEKFKVDDSHSKIRGFVCAYDENGNLVFTKENMIVESGRRFILNNGIKADSLKYVVLSTNGVAASPDDNIATLNSEYKTNSQFPFTENFLKDNYENISFKSQGDIYNGSVPVGIEYKYDISDKYFKNINDSNDKFLSPQSTNGDPAKIVVYNNSSYRLIDDTLEKIKNIIIPVVDTQYGKYTYKSDGLYNGNTKITTDIDNININSVSYKWYNSSKLFEEKGETITLTDKMSIRYFYIGENNYFSYDIDSESLVIRCLIVFNDSNDIAAQSLGIIAQYPEDEKFGELSNQEVLFSRVTFPTYYKSTSQRLTFKYYIYF